MDTDSGACPPFPRCLGRKENLDLVGSPDHRRAGRILDKAEKAMKFSAPSPDVSVQNIFDFAVFMFAGVFFFLFFSLFFREVNEPTSIGFVRPR